MISMDPLAFEILYHLPARQLIDMAEDARTVAGIEIHHNATKITIRLFSMEAVFIGSPQLLKWVRLLYHVVAQFFRPVHA